MSDTAVAILGPFTGGLNLASDPSSIGDSDLQECINFNLDLDGSLVCRPPIVETANLAGTWTQRIVIIGRGVFSGGNYLIGSNTNGTYAFDGTTWTTIKTGLTSKVALQYNGYVWIIPAPGSVQSGGRWDGTTFTTHATLPEGEAAIFHKTRLFIVPGVTATTNTSRLKFSDTITSTTAINWTSTNIIDVSPGDGHNLIDIEVYNDNLILFKEDSTYILAYDLQVSDGILRNLNPVIGSSAYRCMLSYENSIFVLHEGKVYELIDYNYIQVNTKCPFVLDLSTPSGRSERVFISLVGDLLVVGYFNKNYCYNLVSKTWSEWKSDSSVLHNFGPLLDMPVAGVKDKIVKYYAGSRVTAQESVFYIQDTLDNVTTETTKELIVNHVTNPSFETNTTGWSPIGDAAPIISTSTDHAYSGTKSCKVQWQVDNTPGSGLTGINYTLTGLTIGQTYTASAWVYTPTGGWFANMLVPGDAFTTTNDTYDTWQEITAKFVATATSHLISLWPEWPGESSAGHTTYFDAVSVIASTSVTTEYFDGDTSGCSWTGTAHGSKSQRDTTNIDINCSIKTKNLDFASSFQFKRLMWWGADLLTSRNIEGRVNTVVVTFGTTWEELHEYTWDDLAGKTWDNPLSGGSPFNITEIANAATPGRLFTKFKKSIRFRQVNFVLNLKTKGYLTDGPARIFSVTAFVKAKELVSKQVG